MIQEIQLLIMSDADNIDDLINQLKNNNKQAREAEKVVKDDVTPPETKEELEKFIIDNSTSLITQTLKTIESLKHEVMAAPDPDNISAYSELVKASSTCIDGLNKIVLMNKRNETTLSAKKMDIESRQESDDKRLAIGYLATREEMLDKLLSDAKIVDITEEVPKLSGGE